ncbi:MAG TPA: hypothetical protein VGN01_17185 [Acidobacteriaceae bacterium]
MAVWPVGMRAGSLAALTVQTDGSGAASAAHLDTAKEYFDRARKLGFPAAADGSPYALRAEFTTRGNSGTVQMGSYTDIWMNEKQWRREAVLGKSRFVRSQNGKRFYRVTEGPDADLLQFVLTVMEPIPTTEHFVERNWKVSRESVGGAETVRVSTGREMPEGTPEADDFAAYWFDESGQLVRLHQNSMEARRSRFEDFNGTSVARRVEVLLRGKVGMRIDVTGLGPAGSVDSGLFTMKGHDWRQRYGDEIR